MLVLYSIGIHIYKSLIWAISFFHPKAKQWVEGRRNWRGRLADFRTNHTGKVCWMHVSSLGEFEQGRPLLEALKAEEPDVCIVLSFFSPSGYEVRKNYPLADLVCYLPADTQSNARDFLDLIRPDVAVFVKYDFWYNYLTALHSRQTPTLLVSAVFRANQPFFKWYGAFWLTMLGCFSKIYVQDEASVVLLQKIGISNVQQAGDTRLDRVIQIATAAQRDVHTDQWKEQTSGSRCIVAGSTWAKDEAILATIAQKNPGINWIIAPHTPTEAHINDLRAYWPNDFVCYSSLKKGSMPQQQTATLVIDNIGLLNRLYQYGQIAYIGGGFGAGIHNTLEPAAYTIPVIFGPRYEKFVEAKDLIALGGAFCVQNAADFERILEHLNNPKNYETAVLAIKKYLEANRGATALILADLRNIVNSEPPLPHS